MIPQDKKDAIMNLYTSGIELEFISMQVDLDILSVISVLKEFGHTGRARMHVNP
jgi:hypothetical protein